MFVWVNKDVLVNLNHVQRIIRLPDATLNVYLKDYSHTVDEAYEPSVLNAAKWMGRVNPEDFPIQGEDGQEWSRKD
jgi:hypothetical protein